MVKKKEIIIAQKKREIKKEQDISSTLREEIDVLLKKSREKQI